MGTSCEGLGENWTNGLDSYNKSIMVCPCVPFGVGLDKESKSRNISYTYLRKKAEIAIYNQYISISIHFIVIPGSISMPKNSVVSTRYNHRLTKKRFLTCERLYAIFKTFSVNCASHAHFQMYRISFIITGKSLGQCRPR